MFALLPDGALPDRHGLRLKDVRERGNWIAVSGLVAADTMTGGQWLLADTGPHRDWRVSRVWRVGTALLLLRRGRCRRGRR